MPSYDFFTVDYVKAMIENTFSRGKVSSIIPFTFVANVIPESTTLMYIGFVNNAASKVFKIRGKSFAVDINDKKGWIVFDAMTEPGAASEVQFTGFRASIQFPTNEYNADTGLPPISQPIQTFYVWHEANNNWIVGYRSQHETIEFTGVTSTLKEVVPIDVAAAGLQSVVLAGLKTDNSLEVRHQVGGVTIKSTGNIVKTTTYRCKWSSDAVSLTIWCILNCSFDVQVINPGGNENFSFPVASSVNRTMYLKTGWTSANVTVKCYDTYGVNRLNYTFNILMGTNANLLDQAVQIPVLAARKIAVLKSIKKQQKKAAVKAVASPSPKPKKSLIHKRK